MAEEKNKPKPPAISEPDQCAAILRRMRGLGTPASKQLVARLDAPTITAILAADRDKRRREIPKLIDQCLAKQAKQSEREKPPEA